MVNDNRIPPILVVNAITRADRKLGFCHSVFDDHYQTCVFSALGCRIQIDGKNARIGAKASIDERDLRGRPATHATGDDGVVQKRKNQPTRRVFTNFGSNPILHRVVLGFACQCGVERRALCFLDTRLIGERSVLRVAGIDGA